MITISYINVLQLIVDCVSISIYKLKRLYNMKDLEEMKELMILSEQIKELSLYLITQIDETANRNKKSAQRVRVKSIELEKLYKEYRRLTLICLDRAKKDI